MRIAMMGLGRMGMNMAKRLLQGGNEKSAIDAYEKVLMDCMSGDQMLFWRHRH